MPQSLAKIEVLLTWSTKDQQPFLNDHIKDPMFAYLGGICRNLGCNPIRVGGHKDHVHVYCILSKRISLIHLVDVLKEYSSKWIQSQGKNYAKFCWQDGYHALSVNPKQTEDVILYLDNQDKHHGKKTFQQECRLFFRKFKIAYDERYVWD